MNLNLKLCKPIYIFIYDQVAKYRFLNKLMLEQPSNESNNKPEQSTRTQ